MLASIVGSASPHTHHVPHQEPPGRSQLRETSSAQDTLTTTHAASVAHRHDMFQSTQRATLSPPSKDLSPSKESSLAGTPSAANILESSPSSSRVTSRACADDRLIDIDEFEVAQSCCSDVWQ